MVEDNPSFRINIQKLGNAGLFFIPETALEGAMKC